MRMSVNTYSQEIMFVYNNKLPPINATMIEYTLETY